MERSYLANLMSNVQKMHNDLERSSENDRRRLEGQLKMLDNQTSVGGFNHFNTTVRISGLNWFKIGNAAAASGGVSIMGAASKDLAKNHRRPQEDSLAKQLKPADTGT